MRSPSLPDLVSDAGDAAAAPDPKNAFFVWSQTVFARERLTSAVELYDRERHAGQPLRVEPSRVHRQRAAAAGGARPVSGTCSASRCRSDRRSGSSCTPSGASVSTTAPGRGCSVGTIVLHLAVDDYRTLPFITSQSPYFELFRPSQHEASREAAPGNDVHVAIYGWGLEPVYTSGLSAWPITTTLFQRIYDPARRPFWETIRLGEEIYQVYFTNDRARIYAIGYPILTLFDHLVHLAEVSTLAGAAFVLVLLATAIFTRVSRERPRVGRALLREIRASFYRKLFLAFVLASIIPVLILAFVIRAYFADLLRQGHSGGGGAHGVGRAARDRGIRRALEPGRRHRQPPNDDVMVWISQVIDQDVNIFDGPKLVATSERDLFASGLLPTRTPDDVYRAIVLQRLPSFVDEDQLGAIPYLIAATPVRTGGRERILTVPAALRQRDIEREIDDLDRGVHLAVLCFILLGAALGLSLAERIADPVRRLTRATQRIARGDFDERIAVRSVDEFRRLVDAFNSMAGELKAQRARARAHPSPGGVGRDGAAGGSRNQEPADADSALGRAPAARPRRQGPAARRASSKAACMRSSARCGCFARSRPSSRASRRRRTVKLVPVDVPDASRRDPRPVPRRPGGSRSKSGTTPSGRCRPCSSTGRSSCARSSTSSRTPCTPCPVPGSSSSTRPREAGRGGHHRA